VARWKDLSPEELAELARTWFRHLRGEAAPDGRDPGQAVVLMNFGAPPEQQWAFVLAALAAATSDDDLGHLAAGPLEHLLGWHGEKYVDAVEQLARKDARFARTLTGVLRYKMTDAVWRRVQALQATVRDPLT
jgi:hypothetical protein